MDPKHNFTSIPIWDPSWSVEWNGSFIPKLEQRNVKISTAQNNYFSNSN